MKTLCMVPCGNRKIWDKNPKAGPTEAEFVYIGPFAKMCIGYAKRFYPSSWCILSAKHGFLLPNDKVPGPYNVSFNDPKTNPATAKELSAQVKEKALDNYDKIVFLGGKNYVKIVREVFPEKKIITPLSDCKGIGYMLRKLNHAIENGVPL